MPLPLIEVLSALSTLLGTYQVVRTNKPASENAPAASPLTTPGLMIALDYAQREVDEANRLLDGIRSRLLQVAAVSGGALAVLAGVAALDENGPEFDSVLFLVPLGVACFVVSVAVLVRSLAPGRSESPIELYAQYLVEPDADLLTAAMKQSSASYEGTHRLVAIGQSTLVVLSVALVVQLVILCVWIPVAN